MNLFLKRLNLPLTLGLLFTGLIIALAIFGPVLAPQDPMKENYSLAVNGRLQIPPYPPFSVDGYWLGTDRFGRDLFSRILWGIRPTLTMVGIIAAVRLVLALLIGMAAGWSKGRLGRALEALISAAGSLPVLIVALIVITAVGIQGGIPTFIFGLALTGWAETAHLVNQETRRIRSLTYIEVATALGASNLRIVLTHILRQILPLIWMLLAFEVSATLIVVAELGFLGYYIGGGVWIEIWDFQVQNTAGLPELGQILATSLVNLTRPLPLVVAGSVLFLAVLGFNLLGEGLRRAVSPEQRHTVVLYTWLEGFTDWFDEHLQPFITKWKPVLITGAVALLLVIAVRNNFWQKPKQDSANMQGLAIPGNHLWASERRDSQGSRWIPYAGPTAPQLLWQTKDAAGYWGGPAITADGTIIVAGRPQVLLAYSPEGALLWKADLPAAPIGAPALDQSGNIYVADLQGGLAALTPTGELLWHYLPEKTDDEASSGPIVSQAGMVFYARAHLLEAVSTSGAGLWSKYITSNYLISPPRLSPREGFIFIKNSVFAAQNGSPQNTDALVLLDPSAIYTDPEFFIGADAFTYDRSGHGALRVVSSETGFVAEDSVNWDPRGTQALYAFDAGATPNQLIWLFYRGTYSTAEVIWLDMETKSVYSKNPFRYYNANLIAIDPQNTAYLCAPSLTIGNFCGAVRAGVETPLWEFTIEEGAEYAGGAVVPGKIIFTTRDGYVFVIGDPTP